MQGKEFGYGWGETWIWSDQYKHSAHIIDCDESYEISMKIFYYCHTHKSINRDTDERLIETRSYMGDLTRENWIGINGKGEKSVLWLTRGVKVATIN